MHLAFTTMVQESDVTCIDQGESSNTEIIIAYAPVGSKSAVDLRTPPIRGNVSGRDAYFDQTGA
jgi:hypothetical protein